MQDVFIFKMETAKGDALDNHFHHPGPDFQTLSAAVLRVHIYHEVLGRPEI